MRPSFYISEGAFICTQKYIYIYICIYVHTDISINRCALIILRWRENVWWRACALVCFRTLLSKVFCGTLQHTATHCSTSQHTAIHCNTLQRTTMHCNTLRRTATHNSTLLPTVLVVRLLEHLFSHIIEQGLPQHTV